MFQQGRIGPGFAMLPILLIVPLKADSSVMQTGSTADFDNRKIPVSEARAQPATVLTRGDLKSLFTFEPSPQDRQIFYLHDSKTTSAGIPLPDASKHPLIDRLKHDVPGDSYRLHAHQLAAAWTPVGAALQADPSKSQSRLSSIPSSVQGLVIVMAGLLVALLGGAIVLAALVVAVSLLSGGSDRPDGINEESAFRGNGT